VREFLAFSLMVMLVISAISAYLFTIEKGITRNEYSSRQTAQCCKRTADESSKDFLGNGVRPESFDESAST
jgi:hypothetical protein